MDILDIDSLLNDDDFCFTEEKIYDDVTNIIKQWKINNKQKAVFDSRTFTRPKQRIATNLESHFKNYMNYSSNNEKLQIGGVGSQKQQQDYLGDISPPTYSSLDLNTNHMLNSLITSADFSNLSFLHEEQISLLNTKTFSEESLNTKTFSEDTFIKNGTTEIENALSNLKSKSEVCTDLDHLLFKENTFVKHVENKQVDSNLDSMLLNSTFNVENCIDTPELNKCNKFSQQHSDIQNENIRTSSSSRSSTGTPNNNQDLQNTFFQSTPQAESGNCLCIGISPIGLEIGNNIQHICDNSEQENTTPKRNTRENKLKKLQNDYDSQLEKINKTNTLFQGRYKSNESANIDHDPIGAIKKRLSCKLEKHLAQNNIPLKENSVFSHTSERLLNKRGTIYDNIETPDNISLVENKYSEENNSNVTKLDQTVVIEQNTNSAQQDYRDRFKTMKLKPKIIHKEFSNVNEFPLENGYNSRFSLINKNSPQQVDSKNDNPEVNKIFKGDLSTTFICKTNSASELEHSVFPKDSERSNKSDTKNKMGFKAKSFHNLASNNFGYSKNLTSANIGCSDRVSSADKLCSKIPEVSEVRPVTSRRTGIVRPSTGIYSKAIIKNKDVAVNKPQKYEIEKNSANFTGSSYINKPLQVNDFTKDVMKHRNEMSRKSRLPETLKSNMKETGIMRPSSIPKK